jgi:hypothetical protein
VTRAACALLAALLLAWPAPARELWSSGEWTLELSGSVKEIARATRGTDAARFAEAAARDPRCAVSLTFADCSAFEGVGDKSIWQSLTRARVRLDLRKGKPFGAVLVYDNELLFGTLDTLGAELGESLRTDSLADLEWDVRVLGMPTDHRRWRMRLYRAYLEGEVGKLEGRVGRQRVAWGVGRLWSPSDRFNFIPPLAIEQDQNLGVDAVDLRWNFDGFTFLEAVYQAADDRDDDNFGLRFQGSVGELDYTVLAGRWTEAWAAGVNLAGNLGDAAFRMEAIYTDPTRDVWPVGTPSPRELDPFWQLLLSVDNNFPIGRGLYVLLEHLYNGNALGFGGGEAGTLLPFFEARGLAVQPASAGVFGGSLVVTGASHQTGLQLGYDVTSILRVDLLALYDWNGSSAVIAPILSYSPLGSVELTLGAQFFAGPRLSQYGPQDHQAYVMAEWFF